MKRNITTPTTQPSLFGSDSATVVLPPTKTPRARAVATTSTAAVSVATEVKTAKTKIAKTKPVPPPVSDAPSAKRTPLKTNPVKPVAATKAVTKAPPAKASIPVKATAPVKASSAKTADVGAKQKIAKTNTQPKKSSPATPAVRVVNEPVFEGGMLWKMTGRNGVAYIKDAALAGELLSIDPKKLAQAAMAVYYDKKGKAFAWQVRFDTERWDEVMRRLG